MLLPASFGDSLEDSYYHLKELVQIWDVAAERQVEITGQDSAKLVQLMTCRDLSKSKNGRCYYCPIIDDKGRLINDPIVLKINDEKWWLSIADSDVILFAKGLAIGNKFDVDILEPNVDIIAVQGPKSFSLMEEVFGKKITELKFFGFDYFNFKGSKYLITQSGWSKQGVYEIYVEDTNSGLELYDHFFDIGKDFNVKPGCPHLIERIESSLLSYGNDMNSNDNPFECGFDKYVNLDSDVEFLGKQELIKIKAEGIKKKLMGVFIDAKEISVTESMAIKDQSNNLLGELRSGVFSPHFGKSIGIAMINKSYWGMKQNLIIKVNGNSFNITLTELPFI